MTDEKPPSKTPMRLTTRRAVSVAAPIGAALVLFLALRAGRREPTKRPVDVDGKPVRVVEIVAREVVPKAVGYGVIQAAYEWELVAEVSGRIVEMNSDLLVGTVLKKGTRLLKIDAADYELTTQQRKAALQSVTAQIQQLQAERQSALANLKIEQESLSLTERELKRTRALFASGSSTQADVDTAKRSMLSQRSAVQALENQLRELPANIAGLRAQARESKADLDGAALDVGRTEILAPFDIRIRELSIQPRELVTSGQTLAVADSLGAVEVPAQLTLGALQPLFAEAPRGASTASNERGTDTLRRRLRELEIEALVRIESGDLVAEWTGKVTRVTSVSSTTRTLGVVVRVDGPRDPSRSTPPPLSGMYVEVELRGKKRGGCLAVPRSAVRPGDLVHVVGDDSRLERRAVDFSVRQASFVCIESGVEEGDQVVLTDLQPAVEGMLLASRVDRVATDRMLRDLEGEGSAK